MMSRCLTVTVLAMETRIQALTKEMHELNRRCDLNRSALRALAREKVAAIAHEILLRNAHGRQGPRPPDDDESKMRRLYRDISKNRSFRHLLREARLDTATFIDSAMCLRGKMNHSAHFSDLHGHIEAAKASFLPILEDDDVPFAVWVVKNADVFL